MRRSGLSQSLNMESDIYCIQLFHALKKEWKTIEYTWEDFVSYKDLGVESINYNIDKYRITCHKKWMLAKIKYGI